jgi:hypothetical protein
LNPTVSELPLQLRYRVEPQHYLNRDELVNPGLSRSAHVNARRELLEYLVPCAAGMVAGWLARSILLLLFFAVLAASKMLWAWKFRRAFPQALREATARNLVARDIELTIDARGLRESMEGIESFAPWSAVRSQAKFRDAYYLELAGGLWAIIPLEALRHVHPNVEQQLDALLREQGIAPRVALPGSPAA